MANSCAPFAALCAGLTDSARQSAAALDSHSVLEDCYHRTIACADGLFYGLLSGSPREVAPDANTYTRQHAERIVKST